MTIRIFQENKPVQQIVILIYTNIHSTFLLFSDWLAWHTWHAWHAWLPWLAWLTFGSLLSEKISTWKLELVENFQGLLAGQKNTNVVCIDNILLSFDLKLRCFFTYFIIRLRFAPIPIKLIFIFSTLLFRSGHILLP